MDAPSTDEIDILWAASEGNLARLQELQSSIRDEVIFRKRCEFFRDCEGHNALHRAAARGRIPVCMFLVEEVLVPIDIKTEEGDTPLMLAARGGHFTTAEYLISLGADIATCNYIGANILHYAAQKVNMDFMQLLLMKGADIEAKSVHGSPLQFAALCGNVDGVLFLLNRRANPNSVSPLSYSPLVSAVSAHCLGCFAVLMMAGADPNIKSFGKSPLAYAAEVGHVDIIKTLLKAGADPNSVDIAGLTPLENAALAHKHEALSCLFPVTRSILYIPEWSIRGILEYIHSDSAKTHRELNLKGRFGLADQNGEAAARRRDYADAVKWYSQAIYLDSSDARILCNRSLCWVKLNEAFFALHDARAAVRLTPWCSRARYREGVAWDLLHNYTMSSTAFRKAILLDPNNEEIMTAFRMSTLKLSRVLLAKYPLKTMDIIMKYC